MFTRVKDQQRRADHGDSNQRIRVMLVDDDELFLKTTRRILDGRSEFEVVATALDGASAVKLALECKPEVVLMDVHMAGLNGMEATQRICAASPGVRVVGLSGFADRESVGGLLRAGAIGYLVKPYEPPELIHAILEAAAKRSFISTKVSTAIVEEIQAAGRRTSDAVARLTEREREILRMVSQGMGTKEIAKALNITIRTVENYLALSRGKLGVHSIAELKKVVQAFANTPPQRESLIATFLPIRIFICPDT